MRRGRSQSFLPLMIQLFGLEEQEQRLIDARMAFGHRVQRVHVRAYRVLPVAAVAAALALYAAAVVALTVRKHHSGSAAAEPEPGGGEPSTEGEVTAVAEAVQVAV